MSDNTSPLRTPGAELSGRAARQAQRALQDSVEQIVRPTRAHAIEPLVRRVRHVVLLAAAVAAVAFARDRIISDAEARDAERLGLKQDQP